MAQLTTFAMHVKETPVLISTAQGMQWTQKKAKVRTKGLDALGQHLLKQCLQLCKSLRLVCCIICQDFYNSWKGFGEKHLFSFQNHQVTSEQGDEGSQTTLHQGD